jgi:cholesterol transport system auxiliary component
MSRSVKPLVLIATVALAGCGSLLDSKLAAPQTYVLRLPPPASPANAITVGSILVQRPEASPGLESNRIALLRGDRRFDFFAASLWAAPAPDVVESVVVDGLRGLGSFSAVFDDSAPFAPRYDLRITLRRFEADYTAGEVPTVHVVLDCTLGRRRDRVLMASFTARGSAQAEADRMSSVVAAFEKATASAVAELTQATTAAITAEKPSPEGSR